MKKNNTLYTICFLLAGMCINSACEDILSESPNSSYERKDFFINDAQADMAVLGIYSVLPGIYGDNLQRLEASCNQKPHCHQGLHDSPQHLLTIRRIQISFGGKHR